MSAWGSNNKNSSISSSSSSSFRSCDSLLTKLEQNNDPRITEVVILPNKHFGCADVQRLCKNVLANNPFIKSINCSGHVLETDSLYLLGYAITQFGNIQRIAIGSSSMADVGIFALVEGLLLRPCNKNNITNIINMDDTNDDDNHNNNGSDTTSNWDHNIQQQHETVLDDSNKTASSRTTMPSVPLIEIDFCHKGITYAGYQAIIKLSESCPNLQILNLSRNPLIGVGPTSNSRDISLFGSNFTLTNDNHQSPILSTVHTLDMSNCGIDTIFAQSFFSGLALGRSRCGEETIIKSLNLSNNPLLGDDGFRLLLQSNLPIYKLYVSNCNLTDKAMECIMTCDKQTTLSWKVLDLSSNKQITAEGGQCIASCFQKYQHHSKEPDNERTGIFGNDCIFGNLLELDLSGNIQLGDDGCICVLESILVSSGAIVLESLDISQTNCSLNTVMKAIKTASERQCLKHLYFRNNQLGMVQSLSSRLNDTGNLSAPTTWFDNIVEHMGVVIQHLHTLDISCNLMDHNSIIAILQSLLQSLQQKVDDGKLTFFIIGGNPGTANEQVEDLIQQIQQIRPQLIIARDSRH